MMLKMKLNTDPLLGVFQVLLNSLAKMDVKRKLRTQRTYLFQNMAGNHFTHSLWGFFGAFIGPCFPLEELSTFKVQNFFPKNFDENRSLRNHEQVGSSPVDFKIFGKSK